MMRWLEVGEYVDRSPTLLGRAWRLVLVTIAALLGALIGGPIGWVRRQWRRHRIDSDAPRTGLERGATLAVYLGFLRYSKLGEWIANRRRRSSR
jgi:hypothetical protein